MQLPALSGVSSQLLMTCHSIKGWNVLQVKIDLFQLRRTLEVVNDLKNISINEVRLTSVNCHRRIVGQTIQGLYNISLVQERNIFGKPYGYFLPVIFFFLYEEVTSSVVIPEDKEYRHCHADGNSAKQI